MDCRHLITIYLNFFLIGHELRGGSFDQLVRFLRDEGTVARCQTCLPRILSLCSAKSTPASQAEQDPSTANLNVRVFLAAYMIALHPTRIFEEMGAVERDLTESAQRLLELFETILSAIRSRPHCASASLPAATTQAFLPALADYQRCFHAWKTPDAAKLVGRIQHALVALYRAARHLPPGPADAGTRGELRRQVRRLREKLAQIAGPDAVGRFDREHPAPPAAEPAAAAASCA